MKKCALQYSLKLYGTTGKWNKGNLRTHIYSCQSRTLYFHCALLDATLSDGIAPKHRELPGGICLMAPKNRRWKALAAARASKANVEQPSHDPTEVVCIIEGLSPERVSQIKFK